VAELKRLDPGVDYVQSRRYQMNYGDFPYEFEVLGLETFLTHGASCG